MIGFYHCDVGLIVPLKEEFDQLHEIAAIEDQYRIGDRVYSHMRFDPLESGRRASEKWGMLRRCNVRKNSSTF